MEFNWKPEFHVTTDQTRIGSNVIWSDVFPIDDRFRWVIHIIPQSPEKEKRGVSDTFVEAIAVAESAMREIATEIEAEAA
ncbi:hypothetical protein GCM10011316_03220 [Roseibium aquae]|uniref:Uncharacterized protein n=1 Tax=Roseibium aquae TaxID=1323746 RepID=A0A916T764_9HYPH|nr:hypothetical protein [Roseibium aquae]GGB34512.1 hypothetical protein GCM10011316_03220 [Roseibium aquae]